MTPCSPVQADTSNKYIAWQKESIKTSNKRRESNAEDNSHQTLNTRCYEYCGNRALPLLDLLRRPGAAMWIGLV